MMIAGYQKMVSFDRSVDYLKFWATVIGKVPTSVAKRMGWALDGVGVAGRHAIFSQSAASCSGIQIRNTYVFG